MAVLVYIETDDKGVKNSSLEALSMAASLAKDLQIDLIGCSFENNEALKSLGDYGLKKVICAQDQKIADQNIVAFAKGLEQIVKLVSASIVVTPNSSLCEAAVSRLAVDLNASVKTNVIGKPETSTDFIVYKDAYTGKAIAKYILQKDIKILTLKKNSFNFEMKEGSNAVEEISLDLSNVEVKIAIKETIYTEGDVLLPDADVVVSAGRGLKGSENWGIIEDLAKTMGAATACSKPVADVGWRPHHEHVGQTGIKVSPNVYIAVGISGAIQHLAGVSSSKKIVVINTDSEAPFFKSADYGVVGDAFDVIPKLTELLKN
jgi:electron transfer flavoprotein alpha subunit